MDKENGAEIMLNEMRHAFDTAYASVKKYTNKTFTVFGAELTMILFYMSTDELSKLKMYFENTDSGWYIFVIMAALAFITSAVLFVLVLAFDRHWHFPPNEQLLLDKGQYRGMDGRDLACELISEYDDATRYCIKKVYKMKILSDIGIYILIGGMACLLIIKIFGV